MNKLILNFQKRTNSVTIFVYLIGIILISLLFNNPIISLINLVALIFMANLVSREKIKTYFKFSCVIFIVTFIFNLILNQRGKSILWIFYSFQITQESLLNGFILGVSFVNLLWAFYIYNALIRVKTVFELLSSLLKNVALIFILTIQFIPRIIQIYNETKAIKKFRTQKELQRSKLKSTMDLMEMILNKAVASFMNVSDTLILRGFNNRQKSVGRLEYRGSDFLLSGLIILGLVADIVMSINKIGVINLGSIDVRLSFTSSELILLLINVFLILLPVLFGGVNYLWWKFYISKITASDTTTVKKYR
ncbi:energy-coupling factor transporter transmembrane component T [Companilactobacillus sp. HBUAS56275]|uniref:Energy-coupling factor transporter transmembrane protein EcfT n=1 Tax=Candidatus Companilactobacillus pullicola TaxID=2838523 RepID=A0A9D1ZLP6_9LACO|nr:energy-coupling factor transporter transmembrane protein EcfT [Candidatus Companilactobacillus pullicola]